MEHTVLFAGTARRDLTRLPPRVRAAVVEFVFGDLARNPHRVGKPLHRELAGFFSARRGPYRVLYRIEDTTVWVVHIDHRADVYRPG